MSLVLSGAGCSSDPTASEPQLPGSYSATVFSVIPSGQTAINVLSAGGGLSIVIDANSAVTGTLTIPAALTGAGTEVVSMAGTALLSGSTVQFNQAEDTFVRDLDWELTTASLRVVSQVAGSASFTITLTRQ